MLSFPGLSGDTANAQIHAIFRTINERFDIDAKITTEQPKTLIIANTPCNTIHVLSYAVKPDNDLNKERYTDLYYTEPYNQLIILYKGLLLQFHQENHTWLLGTIFRLHNLESTQWKELFTKYCFPRKSNRGHRHFTFNTAYTITLKPEHMTCAKTHTNNKRNRA